MAVEPLDLDAIAAEHLNQCGPCDYGLPMGCNCSQSDARPVIARLVDEVKRLRAKLDEPCGSCHPCVNWVDEDWHRAGRKPPYPHEWDSAVKVVHAAEAFTDACASEAGASDLFDATEALHEAVDEWRAVPNTLKGWKERAQRVEAEVVRLRDMAEGLLKRVLVDELTDRDGAAYDGQAEAALKVVYAAEVWRDARARIRDGNVPTPTWVLTREVNDAGDSLAAAVDEWRSRA